LFLIKLFIGLLILKFFFEFEQFIRTLLNHKTRTWSLETSSAVFVRPHERGCSRYAAPGSH